MAKHVLRAGGLVLAGLLQACGSSTPIGTPPAPPDDGPATSHASLYTGPAPRPGPDILYAPPPPAPQLENTGVWQAPPILISGASAYRRGEFLYQDFLYDDHGANGVLPDLTDPRSTVDISDNLFSRTAGTYTYPQDPIYAHNAADLVEFRVRALADATAFRFTLNTLQDAERVALTLGLGDRGSVGAMPHGANMQGRARWALTVHGNTAELRDLNDDRVLEPAPRVSVDLLRRQIEVQVAHAAWHPQRERMRLTLGAGLWDRAAQRYLVPGTTASTDAPGGAGLLPNPAAFFNLGFRYNETLPDVALLLGVPEVLIPSWWRDQAQARALADGDFDAFAAEVDFGKLADGIDDDMPGQPGGVPQSGPINRILASRFAAGQGIDYAATCGDASGCIGILVGQLQPYALYVPAKAAPSDGYGFTLLLHALAANYNQYLGSRHQQGLGDRGRGHLVATPAGRGPNGWYVETAEADVFEVWADVARHYPLHPDYTVISGYSMGGYGSFRLATRYPDLFAKVHTVVGPPAVGIWAPPLQPSPGAGSNTYETLPSLYNVPILMWVMATDELVPYSGTLYQALELDRLGYRYRFDTFAPGEHLTFAGNDEYGPAIDFLGDARVDRDPPRIRLAVDPQKDYPAVGVVADHAYWISGIRLQDPQGARGLVDARSAGFGIDDALVADTRYGVGVLRGGTLPAIAYTSQSRDWSTAAAAPTCNHLQLNLQNIAELTIHPARARLDCGATVEALTDTPVQVHLAGCDRTLTYP